MLAGHMLMLTMKVCGDYSAHAAALNMLRGTGLSSWRRAGLRFGAITVKRSQGLGSGGVRVAYSRY